MCNFYKIKKINKLNVVYKKNVARLTQKLFLSRKQYICIEHKKNRPLGYFVSSTDLTYHECLNSVTKFPRTSCELLF